MKQIVPPTALIGSFSGIVPPAKGGTGGDTGPNARTSLGLLDKTTIGLASGAVPLDATGKVSSVLLSSSLVQPPNIALIGDSTFPILAYAVNQYKITNYDSRITYNVSATEGSVSILVDTITYTSPTAASSTSGFTINGTAFVIPTLTSAPTQPTIGVPLASTAVYGPTIYPTTSAFASFIPADTHASTDWQIASDSAFSTIIASSTADTVNKVSWSASGLPVNSTLYIRSCHTGTSTKTSAWSTTRTFLTKPIYQADQLEAKLVASDKATGDLFGIWMSMTSDSTRMVVSARTSDPGGTIDAGAVYVFLRTGNTWTQEAKLVASDKAVGDSFSTEVAISGDGSRVFIGAHLADISGTTDAGAVYIFSRSGTTWTQEAKLVSPTAFSGGYFGLSIGVSTEGTRIAVGCQGADISAVTDTGAIYVFSRSGTTWSSEATLLASDRVTGWFLGYAVKMSLDGSRVVSAALAGSSGGAAYVFLRSGTTWAQEAKLVSSDLGVSDSFGRNVWISGNGVRVVVGAYLAIVNNFSNAGAAYVFVRSGTTWTQEAKLVSNTVSKNGWFGQFVTINNDGSKILVNQAAAANIAQGWYPNTASVPMLLFQRTGTTWAQGLTYAPTGETASGNVFGYGMAFCDDGSRIAIGAYAGDSGIVANCGTVSTYALGLNPVAELVVYGADKVTNDGFGSSVALSSDGTRMVAGAYNASPGGTASAGAAYVFTKVGTTWTQEAKLVASDKVASDLFGVIVGITADGTRIVAGAQNRTESGFTNCGAAYIFSRSGTTWTQEQKITASDKAANYFFGYGVGISADGTRIIIGARSSPGGTSFTGAGYIFLRSGTTWTQEAILAASDKAANDTSGNRVAICSDGSRAIIASYLNDPAGVSNAGAAYIWSRSGTSWTQEAKLVASDPVTNDQFGVAVAINSDGSRVVIGANNKTVNGFATAGVAYVFSRSGITWTQEQKIAAADPQASAQNGIAVNIDSTGTTVVVGAYGATSFGITCGLGYKFTRNGSVWTQIQQYTPTLKNTGDAFGFGAAISSDGFVTAFSASAGDGGGTTDSGTASIYA